MINNDRELTTSEMYNSVGGTATHVLFLFPGRPAIHMGNLISLAYSTYRDKSPVFNLGQVAVDGFAIGKRYVAGTIVKAVFNYDHMDELIKEMQKALGLFTKDSTGLIDINQLRHLKPTTGKNYHHLLRDDIGAFDVIIMSSSEYGQFAITEVIYGVSLINSGRVHSIQDLITEETMSFVAKDVRQAYNNVDGTYRSVFESTPKRAASVEIRDTKTNSRASRLKDNWEYIDPKHYYGYDPVYNGFKKYMEEMQIWNPNDQEKIRKYIKDKIDSDPNWAGYYQRMIYEGVFTDDYLHGLSEQPVDTSLNPRTSKKIPKVESANVKNIRMVDGDTMSVDGQSFRIFGIDTPERAHRYSDDNKYPIQPYAVEAENYAKHLASTKDYDWKYIPFGGGYGRSAVFSSEFARDMIRAGYSEYNKVHASLLTPKEESMLIEEEKIARDKKIGIWSDKYAYDGKNESPYIRIKPSEWRRDGYKRDPYYGSLPSKALDDLIKKQDLNYGKH